MPSYTLEKNSHLYDVVEYNSTQIRNLKATSLRMKAFNKRNHLLEQAYTNFLDLLRQMFCAYLNLEVQNLLVRRI